MGLNDNEPIDTLEWLWREFKTSPGFCDDIGARMREEYEYGSSLILNRPNPITSRSMRSTPTDKLTTGAINRLLESIRKDNGPTAARKAYKFLSRIYNYGLSMEYVAHTPCIRGAIRLPKERRLARLPYKIAVAKLTEFAKERGERTPNSSGSVP